MKHGQKAKGKAAKAKASKKTSSADKKKSKISQGTRRPKEHERSATRGRPSVEGVSFNNPTVAAAFRRAVKKYPNAFRRLTD